MNTVMEFIEAIIIALAEALRDARFNHHSGHKQEGGSSHGTQLH